MPRRRRPTTPHTLPQPTTHPPMPRVAIDFERFERDLDRLQNLNWTVATQALETTATDAEPRPQVYRFDTAAPAGANLYFDIPIRLATKKADEMFKPNEVEDFSLTLREQELQAIGARASASTSIMLKQIKPLIEASHKSIMEFVEAFLVAYPFIKGVVVHQPVVYMVNNKLLFEKGSLTDEDKRNITSRGNTKYLASKAKVEADEITTFTCPYDDRVAFKIADGHISLPDLGKEECVLSIFSEEFDKLLKENNINAEAFKQSSEQLKELVCFSGQNYLFQAWYSLYVTSKNTTHPAIFWVKNNNLEVGEFIVPDRDTFNPIELEDHVLITTQQLNFMRKIEKHAPFPIKKKPAIPQRTTGGIRGLQMLR